MADLTKCMSPSCPMRFQCYRFTAPSDSLNQPMAMFIWDSDTGKCDSFLDIKSASQTVKKFSVKKTIAVGGKK